MRTFYHGERVIDRDGRTGVVTDDETLIPAPGTICVRFDHPLAFKVDRRGVVEPIATVWLAADTLQLVEEVEPCD